MTDDTKQYLGDQLTMFEGGYDHIMVELTCHMHRGMRDVQVGVKLTDHKTGELIAYQVPVIPGDLCETHLLGVRLAEVIRFVGLYISPF